MDTPFNIIMSVLYIIFISLFAIHYIKINRAANKDKDDSPARDSYITPSKGLSFSNIRNQYFPLECIDYDCCFISEYMEEAFNIFLKLSPSMISTLTKADRRIVNLKSLINNDSFSEVDIKNEIDNIDELLDLFIKVSHQMIEKLEEVASACYSDFSSSQVRPEAINAYIGSVNILSEIADNHSVINYEIHCMLLNKYPNLIEPFRIIAGKITYLLFINLISYSNKIDENLFIYK